MEKIIGLGNALVDTLLAVENDKLINKFGLPKGGMTLVNQEEYEKIAKEIVLFDKKMASGGSAANTIHGLAKLGVDTAFIGKIGKDKVGEIFKNDVLESNIHPVLIESSTPSGEAIAFITPDSERTFATYLGAAVELSEDDITDKLFEGYSIFHIEGYLLYNHPLMLKAVKIAKEKGMEISIDMASFNVVEDNLEFLRDFVRQYIDIVFANEEEAKAFTGKDPEEALEEIAAMCKIAVVKVGKKGSFIKKGSKKVQIGVIDVDSIDTTGAGDLYAAGFLYGLVNRFDLEKSGKIGALLSGKVVELMGPKICEDTWNTIRATIREI
jgi:sugar/nucleoside kinase (ribokinase family)